MAKINIPFNNKDYSIDEASLSPAADSLKNHLSTIMNGTGATINFGGTAYSIDSAKLLAATNDFISHLGIVAGNGYKVIVNGTEYSVGSDKVAGAVSELEIVLGGLISEGGDEGSQMPEKNAYGFYFNVPYVIEYDEDKHSCKNTFVFYENGDIVMFYDNIEGYDGLPDDVTEFLADSLLDTIDYGDLASMGLTFSEDGKTLTNTYNEDVYTAQGVEHGIYFGETYVSQDGETFIPYASNKVVFSDLGEQALEGWGVKGHYGQNYGIRIYVSIDGTVVYAGSRYDGLKAYYFDASKSQQLKTPTVSIVNDILNITPVTDAGAYEVYCEDTLVITTTELVVNLSQYVANKNTYILVRAIGDECKPSDFTCVRYGAELVPGLYEAGAIALYKSAGATAIESMLITSWGELVLNGLVVQEDTTLVEGSSMLDGDLMISNKITTIGKEAFRDCPTITGVVLPDGLTDIGSLAFYGCKKMSTISIPDSVTTIGSLAFYQCESLTDATIPDGVTSIENTFNCCYALTTVSLPASVSHIGNSTFAYCSSLESITYRGTTEQWASVELSDSNEYGHNNWNYKSTITSIICTDGTVTL